VTIRTKGSWNVIEVRIWDFNFVICILDNVCLANDLVFN